MAIWFSDLKSPSTASPGTRPYSLPDGPIRHEFNWHATAVGFGGVPWSKSADGFRRETNIIFDVIKLGASYPLGGAEALK
jgi:hypothetical protein